MLFSMEKLEWCGYPTMKKIEDMFVRFDRMYERDGHTHRHRMTTYSRACIGSRRKMQDRKCMT